MVILNKWNNEMRVDLKRKNTAVNYNSGIIDFINYVNMRQFIEVYEPGKSAKDSLPTFYNISKVDVIQIKEVTIIK